MPPLDLSVVVPSYNARRLCLESAKSLAAFLSPLGLSYEVIIVDDGSVPEHRIAPDDLPPRFKLIQLPTNQGKGAAVLAGMQAAGGECCIFTDVDLPYHLNALLEAFSIIRRGLAMCVFGNRLDPLSLSTTPTSLLRDMTSSLFRFIVRILFNKEIKDSQCGFKAFHHSVVGGLFSKIQCKRFAFDVEIYTHVLALKYPFTTIAVVLLNNATSSVFPWKHGIEMIRDLWKIRLRLGSKPSLSEVLLPTRAYWHLTPAEILTPAGVHAPPVNLATPVILSDSEGSHKLVKSS